MHLYQTTTATAKILALKKRIRAVSGGTAASKTVSILICLVDEAQSRDNILISVVSESLPHLRRGAIREFLAIMNAHKYFRESRWNRTNQIYTFETGSKIEFFGVDSPDKVRGPRRDILFINEANNVSMSAFDQLEVRTKEKIYLDWNPVSEFWWYTDVYPTREKDCDFITLTYLDNDALDPRIVESIESRKSNPQWWKVYGLGQLGEFEGRIYTGWDIIDEIPEQARLLRYGLDFGYTNDPTAIVAIYKLDEGYILDEIAYATNLQNRQIADIIMAEQTTATVVADSAEPKSIDELSRYGVTIIGAEKGPGSVNQGIQYLQGQKIAMTKRSLNVIKEYRNYCWLTDKNEKQLNTPEDQWNHAMDAVRYAMKQTPFFKATWI